MSKFSFVALMLLFFAAQSPAQTEGAREKDLLERQNAFLEAVKNHDAVFLNETLAEDYVGVYAVGIFDKDKELSDLKSLKLLSYEVSQIKVFFPNELTGIVAFKIRVKARVKGRNIFEDSVVNCVWTLRGKRWVLSSQSAAKICY